MKYKKLVIILSACWLASCQAPVTSLSETELAASANRGNGEAQYQLAKTLAARSQYTEAMQWMQKASGLSELPANVELRAAAALQVGDWYQAGWARPRTARQPASGGQRPHVWEMAKRDIGLVWTVRFSIRESWWRPA